MTHIQNSKQRIRLHSFEPNFSPQSKFSAFRIPTSEFLFLCPLPPALYAGPQTFTPIYFSKFLDQLPVVKFLHHALFARRNDPLS